MGDFNKVVSFILGLIVVVVFLAVVTGRLNLRERFLSDNQQKVTPTVAPTATPKPTGERRGLFPFFRRNTPTPTPKKATPTPNRLSPSPRRQPTVITNYKDGKQVVVTIPERGGTAPSYSGDGQKVAQSGGNISSIPATGAPTLLVPLALASITAGVYLRRIKK